MDDAIDFRPALPADYEMVREFLNPFVVAEYLLPRTEAELRKLIENGFVAQSGKKVVGFSAVEVYSKKLSEIQ